MCIYILLLLLLLFRLLLMIDLEIEFYLLQKTCNSDTCKRLRLMSKVSFFFSPSFNIWTNIVKNNVLSYSGNHLQSKYIWNSQRFNLDPSYFNYPSILGLELQLTPNLCVCVCVCIDDAKIVNNHDSPNGFSATCKMMRKWNKKVTGMVLANEPPMTKLEVRKR